MTKKEWFFSAEGWRFRSSFPAVVVAGKTETPRYRRGAGERFLGHTAGFDVIASFGAAGDFAALSMEVVNRTKRAVRLDAIRFAFMKCDALKADNIPERERSHRFRWLVYNDSGSASMEELMAVGSRPLLRPPSASADVRLNRSRLFTAVYDAKTNGGVFLGFRPWGPRLFFGGFVLEDGSLSALLHVGVDLPPGKTVRLSRLLLAASPERLTGRLRTYAATFRTPRVSRAPVVQGAWNTWDYYFWDIGLDDVLENAREIRRREFLRNRVKYLVVDDGWENLYGDWTATHRFPGGTCGLAKAIRQAGFVPGLWTGPFLADAHSPLMTRHPDWLIRNPASGRPLFVRDEFMNVALLDPTNRGVRAYLHDLYAGLRRDGFRYFKVDFIGFLFWVLRLGGVLADSHITPLEAIRESMKTIRRAVGDDAYLLGCGGFLPEANAGIFDACRASYDVSSYWSNILSIARDVAVKSLFDRSAWRNDYDFLIVRGRQTAREKNINIYRDLRALVPELPFQPFTLRSGPTIQTEGEVRAWASLLLVSGAPLVLADRLSMLNARGLSILRKAFEWADGTPGRPLDLLGEGIPRVWLARGKTRTLVGVFNWEDRSTTVNAGEFLRREGVEDSPGYDIWSSRRRGLTSIRLPPRDCAVFQLGL